MFNRLVIISNESIFKDNGTFYCDNIDFKSIPEGLEKNLKVSLIARKSNIKRSLQIKLEKIKISSSLLTFLSNIFKTFNEKGSNYLLVSITPYTFFAYLLLFIFRKRIFVYLRSDGYEEYKAIFGFIGPLVYHVMYIVVTFRSHIITCQKRLVRNKKKDYDLVFPSELDINWLKNNTEAPLDKPRLLYAGRIKVEKGVFSLLKIFDELNTDAELSIVGKTQKLKTNNKKINFFSFEHNVSALIKIYDNHNITILPSFTEAHPKVLDESLARARPTIIFEEISHIIQNRYGVFVSKRNAKSLSNTIKFIMNNYSHIQKNIKKNQLPIKEKFIAKMTELLNHN